ncbi:hypothetical protein N7532_010728 [Penicillium argentinense]|uniref:DnaJ homologue subfamily C member 28 conserved domain-containing protein n=1 Tax=Penicillium argentinense TaxID=1131581 RepID=A0A9W9EQ60_9EURO|nr:uncharacterized protein N7532_010728 [Penicillium argentinense]KAJ5085957.1 hypothetical protein N7532_010728 [Penicillium argentinense]
MSGTQIWGTQFRRVPVCALTASAPAARRFTAACQRSQNAPSSSRKTDENDTQDKPREEDEEGQRAMSRRLEKMTEDAILEGGRAARRNIEHAGFSEDLKRQLEERVKAASFKSEHAAAHSILDMPASAGQGTRETATAQAWTGTETLHDSALRMLDDASKPIRTPYKIPQPVDLKPAPKPKRSPGERLADAKDRTSTYALSKAPGFSEEEREAMRREMREQLTPGAHSMPMSIQGLSSLANERIEDAIARGQFRSIKRGKGVNTETDHNANSAFIDTTEYFMNKIIQKQEIVPPWIEKQQELAMEISRFRQRLRADWRRHAARIIASQGGSLDAQMKRAKGHAAAEARLSGKKKLEASLSKASNEAVGSELDSDSRIVSKIRAPELAVESEEGKNPPDDIPHLPPLRDQTYLNNERSYHELAVKHLNAIARSYNLQAPRSAQKPYINLDRELNACFIEVAPQLADEIRRRATERARGPMTTGGSSAGVFGSLGTAQNVRVYEEDKEKAYGLKEMWRDLFSKDK